VTQQPFHPYAALREHPDWTLLMADLPPGEQGRWYDRQRVVVLARGLTQRERRCAVAHELVHAERGDDHTACGRVALRQEQHADAEASRRLITREDLVDALLWTGDEGELADVLHVDVHMVQVRLRAMTEEERAGIWAELDEREAGLPWA